MDLGALAKELLFGLPLVALLLGGLWRDTYTSESPFFLGQRWRYSDVVLVFALMTALGLSKLIPSVSRLPDFTFQVLALSSQGFATVIAVYALLRSKYGLGVS